MAVGTLLSDSLFLPPRLLVLVDIFQLGSRFQPGRATVALGQVWGLSTESSKRLGPLSQMWCPSLGLGRQTMGPENSEVAKRLVTAEGKWSIIFYPPKCALVSKAKGKHSQVGKTSGSRTPTSPFWKELLGNEIQPMKKWFNIDIQELRGPCKGMDGEQWINLNVERRLNNWKLLL